MIIRNRKHLSRILRRITWLKAKQTATGLRLETLNNAVLSYFKRKHRTKFVDNDGTTWQQMQGSTAVYDDKSFKTLLRSKGIDSNSVYKTVISETRDDAVITQLLKDKKISVEEWKRVAKIRYFSPYLRRFEPRNSMGGSDDANKGNGLSVHKITDRVRNSSTRGGNKD